MNSTHHQDDDSLAPTYRVPDVDLISVEHPCIVRNFDNGLRSLGGEQQIKQLFDDRPEEVPGKESKQPTVGVSLRPNDPFAKKIYSNPVATENILLKVTVPKRTGRKRKRRTDDPFVHSNSVPPVNHDISAPDLLRRLADNPNDYTIQPVGTINETHRFRTIPDLQMRADEMPIMQEIREHGMSGSYENLKKFNVSLKPGSAGITAFPAPPLFFNPGQHLQHGYQQHNEVPKAKRRSLRYPTDASMAVPTSPPTTLPKPGPVIEKILPPLRQLLLQRPILTVDVAKYEMSKTPKKQIEAALLYLAYYADCGPWKGAWIRYGVDPRTDPAYRFYQTLHFMLRKNAPPSQQKPQEQLQSEETPEFLEQDPPQEDQVKSPVKRPPNGIGPRRKTRKRNVIEDYRFDGLSAAQFVTHYQLCDITRAPLLAELVNTTQKRQVCDSKGWGWYWSGTLAGIRVLMKEMLGTVAAAGGSISVNDEGNDVTTPEMHFIASTFFAKQDEDLSREEGEDMFIPSNANLPPGVRREEVDRLMEEARRLHRFALRNQRRDLSLRPAKTAGRSRGRAGRGKAAAKNDDDGDDETGEGGEDVDREAEDREGEEEGEQDAVERDEDQEVDANADDDED